MKDWSVVIRAPRLLNLFIVPLLLSVVFDISPCSAKSSSSPGSSFDRASIFVAAEQTQQGSADGGTRSLTQTSVDSACSPAPLSVSNMEPKQGEPVKVSMVAEGSTVDSVTFNGETYKLFDDGKVKSAIVAIPTLLKPGNYQFVAGESVATVTVKDGQFGLQRLTLPKSKDNFIASPGEKETIEKAKKTLSDTKRWHGVFQRPVSSGRMSTRFGVKRIVNGRRLQDYFHSGLDFAAPIGTPVHAAAPGKVIVAHTGWRLHGNVVCIDHGRGVISISIHMTKVLVNEGDEVESGQVVGTVGKTGRASGPHLHYGIYVNNVASNPEYWFRNVY